MFPAHRISFHYLTKPFPFRDRNRLKGFLHQLVKSEGYSLEHMSYIFCNDAYLLRINQKHLKHDQYTDIITFPLHASGAPITADIFISIDRVRDNAGHIKVPFQQELHRVIFHGALHLCGYKDKGPRNQSIMRNKEDVYLNSYFRST